MNASFRPWLKNTYFRLFLFTGCLLWIVSISVHDVEAKKRKRSKSKSSFQHKDIEQAELTPKKEYDFADEIQKTKDLKPAAEERDRPTITPTQMWEQKAEAMVNDKLDEEIDLAQQLVDLTPDCEQGGPVRFRLADLYWEKSKRVFFQSQDFSTSEKLRKKYEKRMLELQNRTVRNYRQIVDDCPDFPDLAKVLFFLGNALTELNRTEDATTYFRRIIKEYPDSPWVGNSWFMIGEYYFNSAGNAKKALRAYKRSEEYRDSTSYGYAVYKQGWCYINEGDWDLALERFRTVVTISEDRAQGLGKKGRLALRREGLKDYVRAYSHVGSTKEAFRTLKKVGGKESVVWMMENLGNLHINKDAHNDTISVYQDLIKQYSRSTRLPLYQGRIIEAVSKIDKKAVVKQAKLLTEFFDRVRKRVENDDLNEEEKVSIVKDLGEAEEIAENTLRKLAMDFHKDAKKLRGQSKDRMYRLAHDLYKHYLAVFPEPDKKAEVDYVFFMRFYYSEVLYKLEKFEEAAINYDRVVDLDPHPKDKKKKEIVLAAAEESVRSYRELVEDLDRKNPPKIGGGGIKPIPEIKKRLISSCRRYIEYVGSEGEKIVEIRHMVAYIYYTYNHFNKAAPAFNDLVDNHPEHEKACVAANLVLDIYNGEKNYKALKETAHAYKKNSRLSCEESDRQKFADIEEKSSFKLITTEYEAKKKYLAAARAYKQFYKDYPQSEFADDAVYNAAVNYDKSQRLDEANKMREFLVNQMKGADPELVRETLFNIAQSYERIVDFDKAAYYLLEFAKRYPEDKKSKDALYNAGLYRATLRDFSGSQEIRKMFIQKYPDDKDAKAVDFAICETLEDEALYVTSRQRRQDLDRNTIKKWQEVHDCYYQYIRRKSVTAEDIDLLCYSQYQRGEIMRKYTKYSKGAMEQENYLLKNWPKWKSKYGLKELPRCATALAQINFRNLQTPFKKYKELRISELNPTPKGKKKFDASVKVKVQERDKVISKYREVVEFGVAEWALAALYYIGEAYWDSVENLLAAPIPKKVQGYLLTKDDKQQLRNQLKDMTPAIEESAIDAYRICVNKANELGVYNKWSMRGLHRLQKLRHEEFPPMEEKTVTPKFEDPPIAPRNYFIVPEGDSWLSLNLKITPDGARPDQRDSDNKKEQTNNAPAKTTQEKNVEPGKATKHSKKGKKKKARSKSRKRQRRR